MLFGAKLKEMMRGYLSLYAQHVNLSVKDQNKRA